ncbi:pentapeptide repeat-containing protein (plasmid) [Streptomyces anulatus]|uniref:pentapeptide repeat-containing protein n=1 Tax=Streptomyces anulatus TaxID=1892 RepID=UPI0037DD6C0C|nr:pentapeptide repeat-containing protein [Streptomyces anulatus]
MWLVAPVSLILVAVLAYGLYHAVDVFLTAENPGKKPVSGQDNVKTTVTALTLVGAVLAGLYAYRKQLLDEGASHRADATQLAERYTKAAEQLGHDQAAVRLAGVYAMARLADDWQEQRQVCINVLCAYLRMPYETDTGAEGYVKGEREVRLTIIRTIRDHLQNPTAATTWCDYSLDFTGAVFDGGDFVGARFSGGRVIFRGARFSGDAVDFSGARFSGGDVVDFCGARFSSGMVDFNDVTFSNDIVGFTGARFSGGSVYFGGARFVQCSLVDFEGAAFSGSDVHFGGASLDSSRVDFIGARFSAGSVDFDGARFSSGSRVNFTNARIHAACTIDWGSLPTIPVNRP